MRQKKNRQEDMRSMENDKTKRKQVSVCYVRGAETELAAK